MQTKIRAIKSVANVEVDLKASEGGALHTLPYQVQWTAKGYGWEAMSTSAVACLVVRPTTVSHVTLWNGESAGGKCYVIERAFAFELVSKAAAAFFCMWLCVHPTTMAAPGDDITVRNNTRGLAATSTNSQFGVDETVIDNGWFPWGYSEEAEPTGVLPGSAIDVNIGGRIIIPPGAGLSMAGVAATVDLDITGGFHWFEVPQSELGLG